VKKIIVLLMLIFSVLSLATAENMLIPVVQKSKLEIDGKLSETEWLEKLKLDFPENEIKTSVYLQADLKYLYIGVACKDKVISSIENNVKVKNGPLWNDDSIEIFIQPSEEYPNLVHLIINSQGTVFEEGFGALFADKKNFVESVAGYTGENFWSIELKIPLEKINLSKKAFKNKDSDFFRINFARNVRNKALCAPKKAINLCLSPKGYFNPEGFTKVCFSRPDEPVFELNVPDYLKNKRGLGLDLKENLAGYTYSWKNISDATVKNNLKFSKNTTLEIEEIKPGIHIYRLEVFDKDKKLFAKDVVFDLDKPVEIWPSFPCRSVEENGIKNFKLVLAPYIASKAKDYELNLELKDNSQLNVDVKNLKNLKKELNYDITELFKTLKPGEYTLRLTLSKAGKAVYVDDYRFYKDPDSNFYRNQAVELPEGENLIVNWDFEKSFSGKRAPGRWHNTEGINKEFPVGWGMAKPPEFWEWSDSSKFPQAIYQGGKSIFFKGRGFSSQAHLMNKFFKINHNSAYHLAFAARGKGILSVLYYVRNSKKQWMNIFFKSRQINLTPDWRIYRFDPARFHVKTDKTWGGAPLDDERTDSAVLAIWLHDDGFAFIDNVVLIEQKR
jgi:hypothetical protein